CLAKRIGCETVADDPSSSRRRAREIKIMLRHGVRTGKHGGHIAEKRQKASDENESAAITHEQPLTDSYASFREPETSAISRQQLMPESPADPKADDLAQNCRNDSGSDQRPDIAAVVSGGEKSSRDQGGLGRQRNPDAFERDERCNQPDSVD